jgi:hypothetical protein
MPAHQRVVQNMLPQASDDCSPSRTALDEPLTLNKKQSWFGSFRSAVHRGALSAKAAVESLRGSHGSMYVYHHVHTHFSPQRLTGGIVHQTLTQIARTPHPSSALHPTSNQPATDRRHPDLPSRLCARISAGTHAIPVEEAYQTSSAGASMHLVFVGLLIWKSSSTTRQGREKQHLLWANMETRAWTLPPWSLCHLRRSTYQYRCLC